MTTPLGRGGLPPLPPPGRDRTNDLIVVVPGIMGSALRMRHGRMLWGLRDLRWYARAWHRGDGLEDLALTAAELDAIAADRYDPDTSRVEPCGLLEFPAWMPFLGGAEPYTTLVQRLRTVAADDSAVIEFPYDWRLPVTLNSRLLARTIAARLAAWRAHPAQAVAAELHHARPPQVVIVAHSMGGLVAQGLSLIDGGTRDVRTVITLGTPFYGSVKAAAMLGSGRGTPVPMPSKRLRNLVATLPGVYDLLPTYRCHLVTTTNPGTGTSVDRLMRLTPEDVVELGGDPDLARASFDRLMALREAPLTDHRAVVGIGQPTAQSLRVSAGQADLYEYYFRLDEHGELVRDEFGRPRQHDRRGDGTVFRGAASPQTYRDPVGVTQQHGALAATPDTLGRVAGILTHRGADGVFLGAGDLGLRTPDAVAAGDRAEIRVDGDDGPADPAAVTCDVTDADTGRLILRPRLAVARDGTTDIIATIELPQPGLYRVAVKTGGADPVTRLMLCTDPTDE